MKQAIVIRKDLRLSPGKLAAQAAHASLEAYKKSSILNKKIWDHTGQKKVVLKVDSENALINLCKKCKDGRLTAILIRDAGKTQVRGGTLTALGIGPDKDNKIDKITGKLKLY